MKSTLLALSLLASIVLGAAWFMSYRAYGLLSYEAYSGVGTELATVEGKVVFYHFDGYTGVHPDQYFGCHFFDPTSRPGARLARDFDVAQNHRLSGRLGFCAMAGEEPFGGGSSTKMQLISVPYWFLFLAMFLLAGGLGVDFFHRRRAEAG